MARIVINPSTFKNKKEHPEAGGYYYIDDETEGAK